MDYQPVQRLSRLLVGRGFRGLLVRGIAATVVVLLTNIVLLVVSTQRPETPTGARLLFEGDCDVAASRSTVAHLAINVLATLVLGASNAAMQCLSAPTRADIDRVHSRGGWLDVGGLSLRNLFHGDRFRQCAWLVLLLTSVPLHLVYNSVFLQSTSANAYNALVVSQDFLHGAFSETNNDSILGDGTTVYSGLPVDVVQRIQSEALTYTRLSWEDCRSNYAAPLVKSWGDVVVVTNATTVQESPMNTSLLIAFMTSPSMDDTPGFNLFSTANTDSNPGPGGLDTLLTYSNETTMFTVYQNGSVLTWTSYMEEPGQGPKLKMLYCYARPTSNSCTLEIFQPFLLTVIVANVLKIFGFVWTLYRLPGLIPLVTFGDAVSSFLTHPDPLTSGGRAIDGNWVHQFQDQIEKCARQKGALYTEIITPRTKGPSWLSRKKFWIEALSRGQRAGMLLLSVCLLLIGGIFIAVANNSLDNGQGPTATIQDIWNNGIGNVYPSEVFSSSLEWTVGGSLVVANTPQLLMSAVYVCYNQYFTRMFTSAEAQSFCERRQYLRVSRPRGNQRVSYWLGLPLMYCIPMLATCAVLHWALSQTIFIAEVNIASPPGQSIAQPNINSVGYSIIGAIMVTGLTALLIVSLLLLGFFRHFPISMPILGGNSLAISAACHGRDTFDKTREQSINVDETGAFEAEASLKYGVTKVFGEKSGLVGFSCNEVLPLEEGWTYGLPEYFEAAKVYPKHWMETAPLQGNNIDRKSMKHETTAETLPAGPGDETSHLVEHPSYGQTRQGFSPEV